MFIMKKAYKEALKFLYSLQKFGIKFGLSKTENLLERLNTPQRELKFIHIAGTNGKGSVANYLNFILMNAGYRVGLYTSPHLVSFTERMRINGKNISKRDVVHYTKLIKEVINQNEPPTFFEAVTAMAIKYFADKKVDIVILETGMGGRLDATNIINPILTIITNVSLEHQEFLGNTIEDITKEKAGIIKEKIPLVTGITQEEAIQLVQNICKKKNVKMYLLEKDFFCEEKNGIYNYFGLKQQYKGLKNGLMGIYQKNNLAISLASVELLNNMEFCIKDKHVIDGVKETFWPGRMHIISERPIILLDGAHNLAAMHGLKESLKNIKYNKLILIIGIMQDKDIKDILDIIVPVADLTIYTRPEYYRAMDPFKLKEQYPKQHNYEVLNSLESAILRAKEMAMDNDMILITGSLFTVGEALTILDPVNYPIEEV